MAAAYFPAFHVGVIDSDGYFQPLGSAVLDVEDITTATSLGTIAADAEGYVAEGSHGTSPGHIVEYSHGSYPLAFRQTVTTTQDEAYLHPENSTIRYILENSYALTTEVETAELYAQDLDDMSQRPVLLGTVRAGVTTNIPYQSTLTKNLRLMLVSRDSSGAQDQADFAYTEFEDVTVPALTPVSFPSGTFKINDSADDHTMTVTVGEDFTANRTLTVTLGNANRQVDIEADLLVAGNAIISGINMGDTITVGTTPIGSGTNSRLLFQAGGVVSQSANLTSDGTNLSLTNPAAASGGTPSQPSPYLHFNGASWSGSASVNARARIYVSPAYNLYGSGPKLVIDFDSGGGFGAGGGTFSYGNPGTDYLTTRLTIGNPSASGQGGILEATYDGQFTFKTIAGALSGLQPGFITWNGSPALGYQSIRPYSSPYGITFQSQFGQPIQFKHPESGFGPNYPIYIEPDVMIGASSAPSAALHIIKATEQLRIGYDSSNYYKTTVGSAGAVTFDAVGSGAKFVFSDQVEVAIGTGGETAHVGGKLFQHYTDETTAGTTQEQLYTFTLPAASLLNNGDTIKCEFGGIFTGNGNTKRIYPKFGGTVLATGQTSSASATDWTVDFYVIRVSNTVVRYVVEFTTTGDAPTIESGEITGLNLTTTAYDIDLDGRSVSAAGELTAHSGIGLFYPGA